MAEKLGGLSGTPWHIEYVTKKEDDPRRDKRRCLYFVSATKRCKLNIYCNGSAHCKDYRDLEYENQQKKMKEKAVSWKAESKFVRDPNVVQICDDVELYCFCNKKSYRIHIAETEEQRAPLAKCCLSRLVGDLVEYNGYKYKIQRLIKYSGGKK